MSSFGGAVFLDRDGIINEPIIRDGLPFSPMDVDEFYFTSEIVPLTKKIKDRGFSIFVISNQPEVARGNLSTEMLAKMNILMMKKLPIKDFIICTHDDADQCSCRKPRPGSIISLSEKYGINLRKSFMIGDRWKDVEAGKSAGCRTIFLDRGYSEPINCRPDHIVGSLLSCESFILGD